jgi:hypothetical protein
MWDDQYGPEPSLTALPKQENNPLVDEHDPDVLHEAAPLVMVASPRATSTSFPSTVQIHKEKNALDNKAKDEEQEPYTDEWNDIRAAIEAAAIQGAARIGSEKKNKDNIIQLAAINAAQGTDDISPTKQQFSDDVIERQMTSCFHATGWVYDGWSCGGKEPNDANWYPCIAQTNESDKDSDGSQWDAAATWYGTDGSYETDYELGDWANTSARQDWEVSAWERPGRCSQIWQPTSTNFDQGRREGSWGSSKTWLSDEEKDRKRWEAIQTNMRRTGLDKSPHVPVNFRQYINLKRATAEFAGAAARKHLRYREECDRRLRHHISAGKPLEQLAGQLTIPECRIAPVDELSLVLARPSMWTEGLFRSSLHTHWPGLGELKVDGDNRAQMQANRMLPAPRTDELDPKFAYLAEGPDAIPYYGPDVPREYRVVAQWAVQSPRYDCLFEHEAIEMDDPTCPVAELKLSTVNETIQGLIKMIDDTE